MALWVAILLTVSQAAVSLSPADFDVTHYDLTVTPDFEQHSLSGEARITFRSLVKELDDIRFSANALTIDRAAVNGQTVQTKRDKSETVIVLPRSLSRGQEAVLTVAYHGVPARGLVFGAQSVYTNYFTCDWMFCVQDRPGDKATIDLTLRLPRGMTSIGIGTRQAVKPDTEGVEAHVWRETTPYSSYVYGFAAGRFQAVSEQQSNAELTFLSDTADPSRLRAMFGSTAAMVKFFEEKAGVSLPHRRYVQVHVPGGAAQEAAAFSLIGDDVIAPVIADPQEDWAIAHELAHQWWGNLVTCADWNAFWLNEGVTTFMVAAWKEHRWGRASYDREMNLARQRADAAARSVTDVKLTFAGPFPSLTVRRGIQYSKGALFVDRLRRELGDEAFWRGLRAYTRAHVGSTVTSRDFQRAFERESGHDLQPLFNEWVY